MHEIYSRIFKALSAVFIAITVGTIGFYLFSPDQTSLFDCFYMTIITLSTVGYSEIVPLNVSGRLFASFLILFGMGALIYFASTIIAIWVELDISQFRRRKKMQDEINNLSSHVIVCGCGTTGSRVVEELMDTRTPFVILDINPDNILEVKNAFAYKKQPFLSIIGDATDDRILSQAGIEKASGLVAALRSDKDNLYLIFSSKQVNQNLRIVARATEKDAVKKMEKAGANKVVAPNILGGLRIASEMIRPEVTEFLDLMLRDKAQNHRIDQINLPAGSSLAGKKLADSKIRKATDILVIAVHDKDGKFIYNPHPDYILEEKTTLIVLGAMDSIVRLRNALNSPTFTSIHPINGE
ncbi:MAG: potassium channel protein [Deltaproteobacteria bacterium]|nr:potassium channel protein [Deltaproteobacteria bacterium]